MEFLVIDRATQSGTQRSITAQGYLLIKDCKLARAGVLEYKASHFQPHAFNDRAPNDMIRVYRSPEEVERAAAGFSGAPVTDNHPSQMLNTKNTKRYQKGHVNGDVVVTDGVMVADLVITDSTTIQNIQNGKEELSNGYFSQYDFTPGVSPEGDAYDAIQHSIRPNHVALVHQGRCGFECRVSDALDEIDDKLDEGKPMAIVTINGVSYEASEQVGQAVAILQATADKADKALKELEGVDARIEKAVNDAKTEMQATIDKKDGEIDALKSQMPTADGLDKMAAERQAVLDKAKTLVPKANFDGKSLEDIRTAVVVACCDGIDEDTAKEKGDVYIAARFDGLETKKSAPSQMQRILSNSISQPHPTIDQENMSESEKARMKKMQMNKDRGMRRPGIAMNQMPYTMNQMTAGTMPPEMMMPGNNGSMMPRMHGNPPNNMGGMNK